MKGAALKRGRRVRLLDNSEAVTQIFGLGDLPEFASLWHKLEVYADRVPYWLLPVATDAFGNLFAVSLRDEDNGSVWFWDHEEEADEDEPPAGDKYQTDGSRLADLSRLVAADRRGVTARSMPFGRGALGA